MPLNFSLLNITLHFSVITTPAYNDTKYSFRNVIGEIDSICSNVIIIIIIIIIIIMIYPV